MIQIHQPAPEGGEAESGARFAPGQLIRHRRYRYRGVVVDLDLECRASQAWHQSNQTQPRRDQPWYHVLVDESSHTTYVAQENLMPDASGGEVLHPLVSKFFKAFRDGCYVRNAEPWA